MAVFGVVDQIDQFLEGLFIVVMIGIFECLKLIFLQLLLETIFYDLFLSDEQQVVISQLEIKQSCIDERINFFAVNSSNIEC